MLLVIPRRLKSDDAVFKAVVRAIAFFGSMAFLASVLLPRDGQRYVAMCLGIPCISLMYPCFWTLPPRFFAGARAAASLAAINSIGNLGGFFGQNLMPRAKEWFGSAGSAMVVPATCLLVLSDWPDGVLRSCACWACFRASPNDFADAHLTCARAVRVGLEKVLPCIAESAGRGGNWLGG